MLLFEKYYLHESSHVLLFKNIIYIVLLLKIIIYINYVNFASGYKLNSDRDLNQLADLSIEEPILETMTFDEGEDWDGNGRKLENFKFYYSFWL